MDYNAKGEDGTAGLIHQRVLPTFVANFYYYIGMEEYGYFSLATDEFLKGVMCLVKSLRRQTDMPIRVLDLGLSDDSRQKIETKGAECVRIKKITSAKAKWQPWHCTKDFANVCYNKLHLWAMPFKKVIYLDADMVVVENMDHLFEMDTGEFAAVPTFSYQQDGDGKILRAGWEDDFFNAGLLVLTPDKGRYEDLLWLKDSLVCPTVPRDTTDQSFLNQYYKGRWHKLDRKYNAYKRVYQMFRSCWDEFASDIHAIHYNLEKPWQKAEENCDGVEKIWWDYYKS